MKIQLRETNNGRFGEAVTVSVNGVEVAFLQGVGLGDIKQRALKDWARAAHEGMTVEQLKDTARYGGVARLNVDDFAR